METIKVKIFMFMCWGYTSKTRKLRESLQSSNLKDVEFFRGAYEQLRVILCKGDLEITVLERWGPTYFDEFVPSLIAEACLKAI